MHDAICCQDCGKAVTFTGKRFICSCVGKVPRVLAEELPKLAMATSELLDLEAHRSIDTVRTDIV